jgi:hypothetical protein
VVPDECTVSVSISTWTVTPTSGRVGSRRQY